jgi:hypothetical protein
MSSIIAGIKRPNVALVTVGVEMDVLADSEPGFKPMNFVEIIRKSPWVA